MYRYRCSILIFGFLSTGTRYGVVTGCALATVAHHLPSCKPPIHNQRFPYCCSLSVDNSNDHGVTRDRFTITMEKAPNIKAMEARIKAAFDLFDKEKKGCVIQE